MIRTITNYDGSIATTPLRVARPDRVEQIQGILRATDEYPSPVRAMGSYHSLTPCASSTGTVVDMKAMKQVVEIDPQRMRFTAQAGLEMKEAAEILRKQNLQFMLNIEIGNMTLGSAACCHTKDSLDGVELGQVNSYVTAIKWVGPAGTLEEASEDRNAELLPMIRASYGLAGIVYEVTFRIKPLEIVRFDYRVHDVATLTDDQVSEAIASNESLVFWTVERSVVFQTRNRAEKLEHEWLAGSRRFGWSFLAAFTSRAVRQHVQGPHLRHALEDAGMGIELGFYKLLGKAGGFTLHDPDKIVDYSKTPHSARYAFTFWAFPRADWVRNLKAYLEFAEAHFKRTGFRCNMPLGSYFIRHDTSSILSYSYDGDVISLDPIHAPGERDQSAWAAFLREFNEWAHARGGIPLLNQSPFVKKEHVTAAYGKRWTELCEFVRKRDPSRRMVNEFFQELLV